MTAQDAVRFLDYQATWCRSQEEHQALCLLLPALMRVFGYQPMREEEARAFRMELKVAIENKKKAAHDAPLTNDP